MFESFSDVKVNFKAQKYGYIGLALMIVLGLVASSFTVVESALASDKSVGITSTLGEGEGISKLERTSQETLPGLPSTTLTFDLADELKGESLDGLIWLNKFLGERYTESDIINVDAHVLSESSKTANVQFFATSNMDYVDGTFRNVLSGMRGIIISSAFSTLDVVSTPTEDGARSLVVTSVSPEGSVRLDGMNQESAIINLTGAWRDFIDPFSSFNLDGNRVSYSYTVAGPRPITVNGFVYDDASLEAAKTLDSGIFSTLYLWAKFTPSGAFTPVAMNFTPSVNGIAGGGENVLLITLAGAQPEDPTTFSNELTVLVDKATQDGLIPSAVTVAFQFEEGNAPAHVIKP